MMVTATERRVKMRVVLRNGHGNALQQFSRDAGAHVLTSAPLAENLFSLVSKLLPSLYISAALVVLPELH